MDTVQTQQIQDRKMERKTPQGQKHPIKTNIMAPNRKGGRWMTIKLRHASGPVPLRKR